jgi:hypothetical protein
MKRLILFGMSALFSTGLYSNPNPTPEVHLNELLITGPNSWKIELYFLWCQFSDFDSIMVQTNSGTATAINFHWGNYIYFTEQDLNHPVTINPAGDQVAVIAFTNWPGNCVCGLVFGNAPNADVVAPLPGQSIASFHYYSCNLYGELFTLSNHPTIGQANDTTGTCGTIRGIVYDIHGQPVPNQLFYLDQPFYTDATGHYSTRNYAKIATRDHLCYPSWSGTLWPVAMEPISYTLIPDSVIFRDIHLLDSLDVGISTRPEKPGSRIIVFPNPVNDRLTISYSTELSAISGVPHLEIFDMGGKMVLATDLENHLGVASIPIVFQTGIYLAILTVEGKPVGTTRFVVNSVK